MKKVKLDKEGCIKNLNNLNLYCPITPVKDRSIECGPWCAWFDIDEHENISESMTDNGGTRRVKIKKSFVTCKGTPIAKLVDND